MNRFATCFALACLAACADEPTDRDPGPSDRVDLGAIEIAVSGVESVADGAIVKLIVDRTSAPAANNVVVRERPLDGSLLVLERVFLAEAIYKVTLEVRDAGGQVFLKGSNSGVGVLQGQTTSVTVTLVPSGAVQVVAELAPSADYFVLNDSSIGDHPGDPQIYSFSGTQRVISDGAGGPELEYVALLRAGPVNSTTYVLRTGPSTLDLLDSTTEFETTGGLANTENCTITGAGDEIFAACTKPGSYTITIKRQSLGSTFNPWRTLEFEPQLISVQGYIIPADGVGSCQVLFDEQLNVLCGINRYSVTANARIQFVVRAFSANGATWSPMPPYLGESGEVVSGSSLGVTMEAVPAPLVDPVRPYNGGTPSTKAPLPFGMHDFGLYHLWVGYDGTLGSGFAYASSTDRRSWTVGPGLLQDGSPLAGLRPFRGLAVFKTHFINTWHMIIVDKNGRRWLATSPEP